MVPRFKVKYQDGKVLEVRVMPKAQVMFERQYTTTMSKLANDVSAEHGYYLAWAALHCAGMEPTDFETFLGSIEEIESIDTDEVEEVDPTQPTAAQASLSG